MTEIGPYSTKNCGHWTHSPDAHTTPDSPELGCTLMLYEAWTVYWNRSDTSTFTSQLPTLTKDTNVPTWTSGDEILDSKWNRTPSDDGPISKSGGKFLVIGVPINLFLSSSSSAMYGASDAETGGQ